MGDVVVRIGFLVRGSEEIDHPGKISLTRSTTPTRMPSDPFLVDSHVDKPR